MPSSSDSSDVNLGSIQKRALSESLALGMRLNNPWIVCKGSQHKTMGKATYPSLTFITQARSPPVDTLKMSWVMAKPPRGALLAQSNNSCAENSL